MKIKMFVVHDSKACVYGTPMFIQSVGSAIRSFSDIANDPGSVVCKHPTDFTLFEIGLYDDQTGVAKCVEPFINHGLASDFKKGVAGPAVYNPVDVVREVSNDNN